MRYQKYRRAIKQIDCKSCIVTTDALNTQKETAMSIIKDTHVDYCLALKENQKTAYNEVKDYFSSMDILKESMFKEGSYLKETELTASGMVTREYFIPDDTSWFEDKKTWKKLTSIGFERKTTVKKDSGETCVEERYFLCSIKPVAELFTIAVRRHWHIENKGVDNFLW